MNCVNLEGRVTRDFELRGEKDNVFCFFTLACDRPRSKDADFVECKAFGKLAESCVRTLKKGDLVQLQGSIKSGSFEKNGQRVYTQSVVADDIALVKSPIATTETKGVRIVEASTSEADET